MHFEFSQQRNELRFYDEVCYAISQLRRSMYDLNERKETFFLKKFDKVLYFEADTGLRSLLRRCFDS